MLRVVDTGVVPVHPPTSDYDAASVGLLRERPRRSQCSSQ
jgi:hypothetical protein